MKILNAKGDSNYHTHTIFCDGKDEPEILVKEAIRLGMKELGFSGHEYTSFDGDFCMSLENTANYREIITDLKEAYRDQISIRMGIERDIFCDETDLTYDYVIGSAHYVPVEGGYLSVDDTPKIMEDGVEKYFGGDFRSYVEKYYETVSRVPEVTKCDIVGHFDLVKKFNEGNRYWDEDAPWYRDAALTALHEAAKNRPVFEINTGGMARGYRKDPYPAAFILEELEKLEIPLILSSDCHDHRYLTYGFDQFCGMYRKASIE